MELKNSDEGVEISLEKEDESSVFFLQNVFNLDSKIRISFYSPDI